jgi:hypothetical protein
VVDFQKLDHYIERLELDELEAVLEDIKPGNWNLVLDKYGVKYTKTKD